MNFADILLGRAPDVKLPEGSVRSHVCVGDVEDMEDADLAQFGLKSKMGKLTVLRMADSRGGLRWWCTCDCGKTKAILGTDLKTGKVKSCGCGQKLARFECLPVAQYGFPCKCGCGRATERYKVVKGMRKECYARVRRQEGKREG